VLAALRAHLLAVQAAAERTAPGVVVVVELIQVIQRLALVVLVVLGPSTRLPQVELLGLVVAAAAAAVITLVGRGVTVGLLVLTVVVVAVAEVSAHPQLAPLVTAVVGHKALSLLFMKRRQQAVFSYFFNC